MGSPRAVVNERDALAARVASAYYLHDLSHLEIAAQLGISRYKSARLLNHARATGAVRFRFESPGEIDVDLSIDLQAAFGLRHSVVICDRHGDGDESLRDRLGIVAGALLGEIVQTDDVLGLGWARSVLSAVSHVSKVAPCPVVQLTGALARPDVDVSSIELVRSFARASGGRDHYYYAPMLVSDGEAADAVRRQRDYTAAAAMFSKVTKAVVGLGGWNPPSSTLYEALEPHEYAEVVAAGVFGDLSGVLIDRDGVAVEHAINHRIIGISAPLLKNVDDVIAIAYGLPKVEPARAALVGGYVDSMVTHASFARALLAEVTLATTDTALGPLRDIRKPIDRVLP